MTTVLDELRRVYADQGLLTPQVVVDDARNPESGLHQYFEWNVKKAAEQHWLTTAADLIRHAKVTIINADQQTVEIRAFVNIREDDETTGVYVASEDVRPVDVTLVLARMERDVAALRRKYRAHAEYFEQVLRDSLGATG